MARLRRAAIDLFWLPLGAGGHSVRWNGRAYEALASWRQHRAARDLYHAALEVTEGPTRYVIEMGPAWGVAAPERGVVQEGPVGLRVLGRYRAFRYEVRRWPGGCIPDVAEAVDSPRRLSEDPWQVAHVLGAVPRVPSLIWGRDELLAGDMWNSNSLIAWLLADAGIDLDDVQPPGDGRAPGWAAGLVLARREGEAPQRRSHPASRPGRRPGS